MIVQLSVDVTDSQLKVLALRYQTQDPIPNLTAATQAFVVEHVNEALEFVRSQLLAALRNASVDDLAKGIAMLTPTPAPVP